MVLYFRNCAYVVEDDKNDYEAADERMNTVQKDLKEYEAASYAVYAKAVEDYDRFVANGKTGQGGILKDRARAERNLKEAGENLRGGQAAYNASRAAHNQLPMTDGAIAAYQTRKSRIWMDDREENTDKIKRTDKTL